MSNHVFSHEDWNVLAAIVDRERMADHLGEDRRPARPSLDYALFVAVIQVIDLR
jgi:hypothetical protein